MTPAIYDIVKPFTGKTDRLALFSIIADEIYFLPHFLRHYRGLGVREFYFLIDRSTDGSFEFLMAQPDCAVLTSRFKFKDRLTLHFGDKSIQRRFADVCRFLIPRDLFKGRWGLVADADEFLVLPGGADDLNAFVDRLDAHGLDACRGMMVDCYPATLADIDRYDASIDPFQIAPFYDLVPVDWPDGAIHPVSLAHQMSVRSRINARLIETFPQLADVLKDGGSDMLHKIPLLRWTDRTLVSDAHTANHRPSDRVQVALAHFKFYPGWEKKVNGALEHQQYARGSVKYRPLGYAAKYLREWPLRNDATLALPPASVTLDSRIVFDSLGSASTIETPT